MSPPLSLCSSDILFDDKTEINNTIDKLEGLKSELDTNIGKQLLRFNKIMMSVLAVKTAQDQFIDAFEFILNSFHELNNYQEVGDDEFVEEEKGNEHSSDISRMTKFTVQSNWSFSILLHN